MASAPDYLNPDLPTDLKWLRTPVVRATARALAGYGCLVDDPASQIVEIVRWPATGTRPVDPDTGDEAGTVEGEFTS